MALEELGYAFVAEDGFSAAESQAVVTYTNWLDLDLDEYEEMLEEGTLEIE
ncbi:hypothetical protein OO015_06765 [Thermomicrobium sp. 4228-Ro]|uniref:hypothetical protein n=1 Tax=Thermomicrobium sp. 4228-Ro TaxID=2993937 RepID=UPI00224896D1|nr:hypothetical protein [Thermomicrobium sp. 4228-Ro]MCX2727197.1 hypothetical protein [Thermomicrobium sp. 4228-Ro]